MSNLMDNSTLQNEANEAALLNDIMYMDLHWLDIEDGQNIKDIVDDLDEEYNSVSDEKALEKYENHINHDNKLLKRELAKDGFNESEIEQYKFKESDEDEFKQRREDII